jgi:hypothetical protein
MDKCNPQTSEAHKAQQKIYSSDVSFKSLKVNQVALSHIIYSDAALYGARGTLENAYRVFDGKSEGTRHLERPRHR